MDRLAEIWLQNPNDRPAITQAANDIDRILRINAPVRGRMRSKHVRVLVIGPLACHFRVSEEDRMVFVETIHFCGPTNGKPRAI